MMMLVMPLIRETKYLCIYFYWQSFFNLIYIFSLSRVSVCATASLVACSIYTFISLVLFSLV